MKSTTIRAVGLALLFAGCGPSLRPDPNPYAITSNVPTAEVIACGQRVLGLGACAIERGKPLSDLKIKIQGYNTGTVRVTSDNCGVEFDARYTGHTAVEVPIPGIAQDQCVIAISVQPEFPKERDSGIVIGSLKAFVRVRVLDPGSNWRWFSSKVSEEADAALAFDAPKGTLFVRGCDANLERPVEAGPIRLKLSELPPKGVRGCVYEGVIVGEQSSVFFTWMVWRHSKNYVPSVIPSVSFDGESIVIQGEPATTVVSVDGEYHVTQSASLKFDRTKPHVVRTLTVGGRNVLGIYDPKAGFKWKQ